MNILAINTSDRRGGAAEVSWGIKTELERRGHAVNLFVDNKYSNDAYVTPIRRSKWINRISRCLATDIDFWMSDAILETEEFKKADIVHCHNLHGNYFKLSTLEKISRVKPIVWTFHDMWPITPHCAHALDCCVKDGLFQCPSLDTYEKILWHNEKYLSWKKKGIYRNSNFNIVVPSVWLKEKVSQSILSEKSIQLIPNGIDTSSFKKRDALECRAKHSLPQGKKIVLFVASGGKSNEWKGWDYTESVISHFKDNDDFLFVCIGGNGLKEVSDNIVYIPYVEDKSILSEYFSSADVFLFTSIAENFPLVVLEAMGSGTPVVSFDVGGVKEAVIHKENGYIAEYKNVDDLIRGVDYIFSLSSDEIKKMSDVSAKRAQDTFSLQTMVAGYLELYETLLQR